MACNLVIRCKTAGAYTAAQTAIQSGALEGITCSILLALSAQRILYVQVADGADWITAGRPAGGPSVTRLRAELDARPTLYTVEAKRPANMSLAQLFADPSPWNCLDWYLLGQAG